MDKSPREVRDDVNRLLFKYRFLSNAYVHDPSILHVHIYGRVCWD